MSKASDYIMQLYNNCAEDTILLISEDAVKKALDYVKNYQVKDADSLFVVIASLNLLNAETKTDELKEFFYQGFIKSTVSKVADTVISNQEKFNDVSIYYDKNRKCLYFSIFEVVFSFHYLKETKYIVEIAANAEPIIWPGIRLQRIAQPIFEYAIHEYATDEKGTDYTNKECDDLISIKQQLESLHCPSCGKTISNHAKYCPNCGYSFNTGSEIASEIEIGDTVQVEVNGTLKTGVVREKGREVLTLLLNNNSFYKVKYNVISSITVTSSMVNDKSQFIENISNLLEIIMEVEGVDKESYIETNSIVRECNDERITAVTDGGKTVSCYRPLRPKSKKIEPGNRIFCDANLHTDYAVSSIIEMTYKELCSLFIFALKEQNKNKKVLSRWISACLSYFRATFHCDESKGFLKEINKLIKRQEDKDSKYEESFLASDIKNFVLSDNRKQFKLGLSKVEETLEKPKSKLKCVEMAKTNIILSQNLPLLPEEECRQIEKELDSLIREGRREECLTKSYTIVTTKRPTPKYLRSYLDRIVNTEIALAHTEKAKEMLTVLIAFSDTQEDTKPNNLSHLYLTLARLLTRLGDKEEAHLALDWAEFIFPKNKGKGRDFRQSIESMPFEVVTDSSNESKQAKLVIERDIVVSKMLIQDVEQYAKTQASSGNEDNEEEASPIDLFNMADEAGYDKTKSFAFRAQMFLDAAAAYLNTGLSSKTEFIMAVAHYARMKGNSLMAKIAESVQQDLDSQSLIAKCDSARSYFLEALGLYNDLAKKRYLQDVLLKYLKIESLVSQIEGGRTPDVDWNKGTLKDKIRECLNDENVENQKVLYRTCIAIGSTSETTWHTLSHDKDGIGPLFARFNEAEFRGKAYQLINDIEGSTVDTGLAPGVFFRKVFENRQTRIRDLKLRIEDCLLWDFSPFDISSFEAKWKSIDEYKDLMTATDRLAFSSINEVINILKPYAGRKERERDRNILTCQRILTESQNVITETTTYYGRILFSHLQEKWLKGISSRFEEIDARTLPQLQILPEPCYLRLNEDGQGIIDFVVTNNGDSTAQSFVIHAIINGKEYVISHEEELSAGDSCSESFVSSDFSGLESVDVAFKLVAKYQGKELPPIEIEATYEVETGDFLTEDEQIPWKLNATPQKNMFKGREDNLVKLISHYLSKERYMTYILYGLTRTGKSSVLDYFCERIKGKHINEDDSKTIMTFKWDFSGIEIKNTTRSVLWAYLLETNIYDKLSDELANTVDMEYSEHGFPEPDKLSQSDLETIIIALNKCNIIPLIAIDEFSYVRKMIEYGLLDITFIKKLRDIAYSGNASFLYAGTYDIKDIPREYGLTGEMNNTKAMRINEIDEKYADELMDVCPNIIFDEKAKEYIRMLSGCVPYWIQWICLNCGKYAIAYRRRHLGYRDVNNVVEVMTGEVQANPKDAWGGIEEIAFYNNQIDPKNKAEHQLISSISYIVRESTHIERGVSMDELNQLWDKYKVDELTKKNMVRALVGLEERRIIKQFTDETREVYRINVDLFRRWWFAHHRDLKLEFSL